MNGQIFGFVEKTSPWLGGFLDRGPFRCDPKRGQREVAGEVSVSDFEGMVLEVAFGAVEADRCVETQPDSWDLLACGLLNPISGSDESEDNDFELLVRHLLLGHALQLPRESFEPRQGA